MDSSSAIFFTKGPKAARFNPPAQHGTMQAKILDDLFGDRSPSRLWDFMQEERSSGLVSCGDMAPAVAQHAETLARRDFMEEFEMAFIVCHQAAVL